MMRILLSLFIYFLMSKSLLFGEVTSQKSLDEISSAVVFMYHRFGNERYPSTNIELHQFEQHLEYIEKNAFKVWPLSKVVRYILKGKKLPLKTVVLTIDDAYISTYTKAYPMLKAKGFPFTVFVSTNAVDTKSKNYMSWKQMREMSRNGAEFANHTLTHAYLLPGRSESQEEWKNRLRAEIQRAQKRLHEELGTTTNENPKLFSYPFGEYNENMTKLLKELGYIGVTQTSGVLNSRSDLRAIPRFAMAEAFAHMEGFILKINTLPLAVESVSPTEPVVTLNNPPLLQMKLKRATENLNCYTADGKSIDIKWISETELQIQAKHPLKAPRDRYTCTAPTKEGRWYWHSNLWIIK